MDFTEQYDRSLSTNLQSIRGKFLTPPKNTSLTLPVYNLIDLGPPTYTQAKWVQW